ncbi:hypothetical protein RG47T_3625 [Mucilaginibacter polytrichastri]|uniref:Uncharacterized protein n=1 Tax=Mucilaginibacter polytrichastri TaxID=1302689 RepID=A0A1Q6A2E7_9SPHI|nr:hypothetical protein RG47T_3625 [Mucilaginibacter polytrichastri]
MKVTAFTVKLNLYGVAAFIFRTADMHGLVAITDEMYQEFQCGGFFLITRRITF